MTSPTRDEVRAAVERLVAEISIVYAADDPVMHDLRTLIAAAEDGERWRVARQFLAVEDIEGWSGLKWHVGRPFFVIP